MKKLFTKKDPQEIKNTENIILSLTQKPRDAFEDDLERKLTFALQEKNLHAHKFSWKKPFLILLPLTILIMLIVAPNFVSAKLTQIVEVSKQMFLKKEFGGPPVEATEQKLTIEKQFVYPTASKKVTQYFGLPSHSGMDFGGEEGESIFAVESGIISSSQCGWNGGYGCYVAIDHGDGVESVYAHTKENLVRKGDMIEKGQTIATMGRTGYIAGEGAFLHFEIRANDTAVNPLFYLPKDKEKSSP